jgi:hypothetical protein
MNGSFQVGATELLPATAPAAGPCPPWCKCRAERAAEPQ